MFAPTKGLEYVLDTCTDMIIYVQVYMYIHKYIKYIYIYLYTIR